MRGLLTFKKEIVPWIKSAEKRIKELENECTVATKRAKAAEEQLEAAKDVSPDDIFMG